MNEVSFVCLVITASICFAGVFSQRFLDNWLQFAGMWAVMVWAVARAYQVWDGAYVSPQQLLAHVGIASFALGTFQKFRQHNKPPKQPPPPPKPIDDDHLRHVAGGRK